MLASHIQPMRCFGLALASHAAQLAAPVTLAPPIAAVALRRKGTAAYMVTSAPVASGAVAVLGEEA
eukprot:11215359-Lingulodinium_polyedra.AAC.1